MTTFVFDPATQGKPEMADTWVFGGRDPKLISEIRAHCPELIHWPDAHLMAGWGSFSQDIMAIGWVNSDQFNIEAMCLGFLAYLYVRQIVPSFDFYGTGLFSEVVFDLGELKPWLSDTHTAPDWAQPRK